MSTNNVSPFRGLITDLSEFPSLPIESPPSQIKHHDLLNIICKALKIDDEDSYSNFFENDNLSEYQESIHSYNSRDVISEDEMTENLATTIFIEHENVCSFLHDDTTLSNLTTELNQYSEENEIDQNNQEKIWLIILNIFNISILNSNYRAMAENLESNIAEYLLNTTLSHFQQTIQEARNLLLLPSQRSKIYAQKLRKISDQIAYLDGLYTYAEQSTRRNLQVFLNKANLNDDMPEFPNAKSQYGQLLEQLNERKKDSSLTDLKKNLNQRQLDLIKSSSPDSNTTLSNKSIFFDVEATVIWTAGEEIVRTAYTKSYPKRPAVSGLELYDAWNSYLGSKTIEYSDIIKKQISKLKATEFKTLLDRINQLHPKTGDDSDDLKNKRIQIIFKKFQADHPNCTTLKKLKKWYFKTF